MLEAVIEKKLREFSLDVAFQAKKGCLGILGPSGCGKSMTLKSIAGIVTPDKGKITAYGQVLFDGDHKVDMRPQKRRVGYLFQNYALFPNMTVEQNIMTGLNGVQRKDKTAAEKKAVVREMIKRFRLENLEGQYPARLSGGQQQRVALARILAYEPKVLLLDEPFSAMDSFLREGLRLELADVIKNYDGVSVLVTHDRDEAYQLCDHLLLLDRGQVLAAGETREIFRNPGTCQAARLTGCKNISRIERIGDHRVRAMDWQGLELTTAKTVSDDITSIGIRAHDFEPLSEEEAGRWQNDEKANLIPVRNVQVSEMPFEWYVTLECGLWWKKEKTIHTHDVMGVVPSWLRVEPEGIILLRG